MKHQTYRSEVTLLKSVRVVYPLNCYIDTKTSMFIRKEAVVTKVIYSAYYISYLVYTLSTQNIEDFIEPVSGIGLRQEP